MKKERDSGMELLRIAAMLLVILAHLYNYGGFFNNAVAVGGVVKHLAIGTKLLSRSAVDIFVIISGFFMLKTPYDFKKSLNRSKDIYIKILFYSLSLSIVFLILGPSFCLYGKDIMPRYKIILRAIFPVSTQQWYFLTDYLLLCLVAPFINRAIQGIEKKHFAFLVAILTFVFSVWQTFYFISPFSKWLIIYGYNDIPDGKNLFFFVYLYILGGFLSSVVKPKDKPDFRYLALSVLTLFLNFVLFRFLPKSVGYTETGMKYSNIFVVATAAFLVLFFSTVHFKSRLVNKIASTTIGIYAIHEFCFVRNAVWKIFDFSKMDCSNLFVDIVKVGFTLLAVFFACSAIELLRQQVFTFVKKTKAKNIPEK